MAFSAQELQDAGKIALDFYLKKSPIDQAIERPLMKALMGKRSHSPVASNTSLNSFVIAINQISNGLTVLPLFRTTSALPLNKRNTVAFCSDGFA